MSERAPDGTEYELAGPEGAPVLVLIHGLGLCRGVWDGLLPAFTGYRVLSYDLYGHGGSAPLPRDASLSVYAAQIAGLMDHLGIETAHIIGFSIGGMINRRFAMDYPERVQSLVILNSPHDRGAGQEEVEARAKTVRDKGAMSTMDAALKRWFTPGYLASHEVPGQARDAGAHGATLVRAWRGRVDPESYAQAAWVLAHGVRELIDERFDMPALVMTCENDSGSTPAMSKAIAAQCAAARLKIVPRLQHLGLMEDPDAFARPILNVLETQT